MYDDKTLREVLQRKIVSINKFPDSALKEVAYSMSKKYHVKYGDTIVLLTRQVLYIIQ
jgi:hypothetical protein